jgi:ABC-2 type transport system permease protein
MNSPIVPIIRREYLSRIMTRGFWLSTAIFPLMAFGFTVLPTMLAERTKPSPEPIVVVDMLHDFFPVLQKIAATDESDTAKLLQESPAPAALPAVRRGLNDRAEKGEIQGYVVIDAEVIRTGDILYNARNPSSAVSGEGFGSALRRAVTKYRLLKSGVGTAQIDSAIEHLHFDIQKATNDPKKRESGIAAFFMSIGLVFFIYFALILYGIYVLRGVLEEKSNRIVEVMISSVKPFQLMMGKILGIGAVGLTQIFLWILTALVISAPQVAGFLAISKQYMPAISPLTLIFFPIYFVLGYFLFATIYAGIGSMFNSDEEAQQMAGVAQLFVVLPMMLLLPVIRDPGGKLATYLSLFPFFAPTLMYLRIAIQTPPAWQIALSIVIMLITILVMVWIVSKIYRVGILMYGKKPTLPELVRWLRYT